MFALCAIIAGCFTYEIAAIKPNWLDILKGLIPKPSVKTLHLTPDPSSSVGSSDTEVRTNSPRCQATHLRVCLL